MLDGSRDAVGFPIPRAAYSGRRDVAGSGGVRREIPLPPGEQWLAGMVFAIGLLLSLAAFFAVRGNLVAHGKMEFDWVAHNRINALKKGIEDGLEAVKSTRDLIAVAGPVSREGFDRYTKALFERYRGIHSLEWVPLIRRGGRDAHEEEGRRSYGTYAIVEPDGAGGKRGVEARDVYFPIYFVSPLRDGSRHIGFDYGSSALYGHLLDRAWSSGQMTVSSRIPLLEGDQSYYGFQAFQPVYARGAATDTEAQRRKSLVGFVVGVFRIFELASASIAVLEPRGVEFLVRDETAPAGQEFLDFYSSRLSPHAETVADYTVAPSWTLEGSPRLTKYFPVADRRWSITCAATDHFRSAEGFNNGPWIVLGGGLSITLLMVLFLVFARTGVRVRLRMAQELLKSEQKLTVLFRQSPDIIMTVSRDGETLVVNRPESASGGRPAVVPQRMFERYDQALETAFALSKADAFGFADDDSKWWELRTVPLRVGERVTAAMVIATDVTEKRMLEAHAMRNARLASLGVLAASVAHEINNPNNAIQFNASILKRSFSDMVRVLERFRQEHGDFTIGGVPVAQATEGMPRLLEGIENGSRRIQAIVGNLKHMARHDDGELNQNVPLGEVLRTAVSILQSQVHKHCDDCRLEVHEPLPCVRGNAQQLEQVFINLILNALQSLPQRSAQVRIEAALEEESEFVWVSVLDQGRGISEENLRQVLEPFFTTKGGQGGTGLGLSISQRIVQNHGGKMEIASTPGKGTEVVVRLPVSRVA
jgi:signal transduction histidine kinase